MPFHHAETQNTPLKLRTTSIPTTGKIFKAHEVNQDLLVKLHGVTLHEDPLSTLHYILELCVKISPTVIQSFPLQSWTSPLKIKSLKLKDEYLYHNGCWKPTKVPNLLRSPATSSSQHNGPRPHKATGIRNVTIRRCISGTLEETITGLSFLWQVQRKSMLWVGWMASRKPYKLFSPILFSQCPLYQFLIGWQHTPPNPTIFGPRRHRANRSKTVRCHVNQI